MEKKRQHFVPQHYLRQFGLPNGQQILTCLVNPYRFIGPAAINRQCQEDYFYGADGGLDDLMTTCEVDLAPVLIRVGKTEKFKAPELVALRMLCAVLQARTRKAVEHAKVFPRRVAHEFIKSQIESGKLPAPRGGWREEMMDFGGVPGFLIKATVIPSFLEMQTLCLKLLRAPENHHFITSDNPVVMLNQFAAGVVPNRPFVGFSQSGFQLLLPITPRLTLFFFDLGIYKVGGRRQQVVSLSGEDVELVNSLQVQSAEHCLYIPYENVEPNTCNLVARFRALRIPPTGFLRTLPGRTDNEEILHIRADSAILPAGWKFCRYRRRINRRVGERRDPAWTEMVKRVSEDMDRNPSGEGLFSRIGRIIGDETMGKDEEE